MSAGMVRTTSMNRKAPQLHSLLRVYNTVSLAKISNIMSRASACNLRGGRSLSSALQVRKLYRTIVTSGVLSSMRLNEQYIGWIFLAFGIRV